MTFPSYPVYKDSGVAWLGDIPAHWSIKKFRYVFEESPEKITDEVVGDMLSVSGYRGIEVKQYDDEGRRRTDEELLGYRVVRPGQLVVNTMWLNYAGLGVSEHEGHVSPAYRSYWIDPAMDKRFIHHLMRSGTYVQGYTRLLTGIRPNSLQMGRDDLMGFPVLLPTKPEQTQIARFLDHETARIDVLIKEQQRLIELLKEKRQAVISVAVTKGLDRTVPMKDSGVEWLGKVPAHWVVMQLSRVLEKVEQGWSPNASNEPAGPNEWGVIKISAIKKGTFFDSENKALLEGTLPELAFEIRDGDVLVTRANTPDLVGDACVVKNDSGSRLMLSDLVYRLRLLPGIDASFICYFLLSHFGRAQIKSDARGSSMSMAKISQGHIKAWLLALPTYSEQVEISKFISGKLCKLDELIRVGTESHTLLAERRSALISAAVTGKIDVRGWQPPASAQAPELAVAEAV